MTEQIVTRRQLVTPALAETWLNRNKSNRKLRPGVVERYAADMKAGRWTNCTAPIAFFSDGDLFDGQHRLFAIIESGESHIFNIMRGLDRRDALTTDPVPRTLVDNARISGEDSSLTKELIAVARAVDSGMPGTRTRSNAQLLDIVRVHRDACSWALSAMPRSKYISTAVTVAAVARAWYHESDKARLEHFCKVFATGFGHGEVDSAAVAMRNYMLQHQRFATTRAMWRDTFLKSMNAIAYFMRERRLTVIKSVKEEAYVVKETAVPRRASPKRDDLPRSRGVRRNGALHG